jgi:uncharacterized MAPEG superfamily protein
MNTMSTVNLTPDLYWLALTGLMTALLWMPHILNIIIKKGVITAFGDTEALIDPEPRWAQRAKRAHINAQLNFGIFAGLLITAHLVGVDPAKLGLLAMIYFFVRLGHFVVYTLGLPFLRQNLFGAGVVVQVLIAMNVLQAF